MAPLLLPTSGREPSGASPVVMTLSGEGFGIAANDVTSVTVGGIPCLSVGHVSSFELRCEVPPGIGTDKQVVVFTLENGNSSSTVASAAEASLSTVSYRAPEIRAVRIRTWGPYSPGSNVSVGDQSSTVGRPLQSYVLGGERNVSIELQVSNAGSSLDDLVGLVFLIDDDDDERRGWGCEGGYIASEACIAGHCELEAIVCPSLDFTGVSEAGVLRASFAVGGQPASSVATPNPASSDGKAFPLSVEVVGKPSVSVVTPSEFPTLG